MSQITLSKFSRYKDTPLYDDLDGRGPKFACFVPPREFLSPVGGWRVHVVRQHEVGMLDSLAVLYFGEGYEQMFWCIALANGLVDIEADMYPGQKLWIPPTTSVDSYVARFGA